MSGIRSNTEACASNDRPAKKAKKCAKDVGNSKSLSEVRTQFGEYLSSQYGVLRRVLGFLAANDLRKASQVCKSWNSAAKVVRNLKKQIYWLFILEHNRGLVISAPFVIHSTLLEHVFSQPLLCIAFYSKNFLTSYKCDLRGIKCPNSNGSIYTMHCGKTHSLDSYLASFLGPNCEIISCPTSGVIGCTEGLSRTFEVQFSNEKTGLNIALLPNIPGVSIVPFKLTNADFNKLAKNKFVDLDKVLKIPPNMLVQALLVLSDGTLSPQRTSLFFSALEGRQQHTIAIGGGIVEKGFALQGVLFLGNDVCAVSSVLSEDVTSKSEVLSIFSKLKKIGIPTEKSLCFSCACLGRGKFWFDGEEGVETSIFNQCFPDTPIVGFFGRGEIANVSIPNFGALKEENVPFWEAWNKLCLEESKKIGEPPMKNNKYVYDHSYSTSILILSFNPSAQHRTM